MATVESTVLYHGYSAEHCKHDSKKQIVSNPKFLNMKLMLAPSIEFLYE